MTIIAFPKETAEGENRCSLLPANLKAYQRMGADIHIQSGLGTGIAITDEEYTAAGATVVADRNQLLTNADIVLSIDKLPAEEISGLNGKVLISYLDPFNNSDYLRTLCQAKATAFSMEMIPRSSRCQKMDALSSQASLAGYVMTIKAMSALNRILPMMMTPSGTIKPAKVFIIGAGVAGLQAIATAKRMGAQVTAFDTRPVVAEQVKSLGGKFLEIDLGDTSQTSQGYAQALTPEQLEKQKQAQAKAIAESDIVITTAQLFGRKPPMLIDEATVALMQSGSVIVDMAAENGGNVQGSVAGETVQKHGVTIIGTGNWSNEVARDASQMYANNLFNLVSEFWNKENNQMTINIEDEIQAAAIITHQGEITNQMIKDHLAKGNP